MHPRPDAEWFPSPNFKPRTKPISCAVIHATATSGIDSPKNHLCDPCADNPTARVSAHYLIGKTGTIIHLVHESEQAWHAGESVWKGQKFVNGFSVGFELVNLNDGADPYPKDQIDALLALLVPICLDYGIKLEDVVGHKDIVDGATPEEKAARLKLHSDPGAAFPWADVRAALVAAGVS